MNIFKRFIPILLLFAFISCQYTNDSTSTKPNAIVPFSLKIAMNNAPPNVVTVEGKLEKSGYNTITQQFIIEDDTARADFGQIIAGLWHLSVTAYDSTSSAIYFGETDINIFAGQPNTVFLQLDPLTGDLVIIVTWNYPNPSSNEYIYMYTHSYSPKVTYRYNFQTSLLEQLTFINPTVYPIYLKNINKIGYSNGSYGEFWIMDPDGQNQVSLFNYPTPNINHPSYSEQTNKIYFYSIESTRRLAVVDYDGQNFQYLTETNNNAHPEINSSGDSLLFHSDRTGTQNIYLLNLSAMTESQITFNSERSVKPRWSSNKNGFYYHKTDSSGYADIMFYNLNNNTSEIFYEMSNLYIHNYGLSPDENKIALLCSNSPSTTAIPTNLYIYDIATGSLSQKTFANLLLAKPRWYNFE